MSFSDRVKYVRAKLLISQTELAELLSVSYVTISRWETNKLNPSFLAMQKFEKLCKDKHIVFEEK